MSISRWGGLKISLGYAVVSSIILILSYAPNDWRRPEPPHIHVTTAVALNLVGAVLVGMLVDFLKPLATSRSRAAGIPFLIGLPVMPLVYFTVYHKTFMPGQFVGGLLIIGFFGACFGATAWLPED